jgi:hypothetical protein
MKTIFDKVDPKYLECATGVCEHSSHSYNLLTLATICAVATAVYVYRFYSTD